jgi:hypothetical protein
LERGPQDSYSQSVSAEYFMQLFDAIKDFQSFAGLKKTGKVIAPVSTFTFAFRPYFNKSIMYIVLRENVFKKWFAGELDKETLEVMNKPRCGIPDRIRTAHSSTRRKRFAIQGRDKQYYK